MAQVVKVENDLVIKHSIITVFIAAFLWEDAGYWFMVPVFSRECATGHIKIPCHLSKRVGHRGPVVGFLLVSFIK